MGCVCSHSRSDEPADVAASAGGHVKAHDLQQHPTANTNDACYVLESSHVDPTIITTATDIDTSHSSQSSSSIVTGDHHHTIIVKPSMSTCRPSWIEDLDTDPLLAAISIPYEHLQLQSASRAAGIFGNVHRATYQAMPVVVHRLDASKLNDRRLRIFKDDVQLLMRLEHPNIVQFIGASWTASPSSCCCLVMELPQRGDLYSMLRSSKYKLAWHKHLLRIATDVATGMMYLHAMDPPVLHRDLQSMHVHVSSNYVGKVADVASTPLSALGSSGVGGTRWMAPERILGLASGKSADVFSFGILLSEMDTSKLPYEDMGSRHLRSTKHGSMEKATRASTELLRRIATDGLRPQMAVNGLATVRALFTRCVSATPSDRPSFADIVTFLKQDVQDEVHARFPSSGGGHFWPS
ncbi:TKL protein kinase [Aphanomyces astaci]|uniref:TKL protein kinase n=1 Tax=Aphanomyces astaci TaxID=112090 RepID=W4FBT0_APHAT|nr:TKL protein kinase [Aphanomyces astaci]ETV64374.1 TKL protein kinase [Aphanomyces astaci]|eukprot:XP_009846137.1 TKL protein kinase [Aphanomyces astaci]